MSLINTHLFLRNILKGGEVYFLKIITLAIAFASSILILLFSSYELGYDRFHKDHTSIIRVLRKNIDPAYTGNRLSNKIPFEIYDFLRTISPDSSVASRVKLLQNINVLSGDKSFVNSRLYAADVTITDIFSFEILEGSLNEFLEGERAVILSSTLAGKYFGTTYPVGKELKVFTFGDTLIFRVAAIYRDYPQNSHEEFTSFISFNADAIQALNFNPSEAGLYLKLHGNKTGLENRVNKISLASKYTYQFQALSEIYFGPRVVGEDAKHGDHYSIVILILITGFILFLAITSFINLTTLTLPNRSKELAIKKLVGTSQTELIIAFAQESCLVVGSALVLGVTLLLCTANWITPVLAIDLREFVLGSNLNSILTLISLFVIILISPLFVTLRFTRATPIRLLSSDSIIFPRLKRTIIFVQLGITIFLIVTSIVIRRQINYSLLKEPGRNHDQVVYVSYPRNLTNAGLASLRKTWKEINPNVVNLMATSQLPDRIKSKELNSEFFFMSVDRGFKDFFDVQIIEGNWFKVNDGDSIVVVNERGKKLRDSDPNVIGVFKDLSGQFNQPEKPIKVNAAPYFNYNFLCIRVLEVDIRRTLNFLETYFGDEGQRAQVFFLNKRFEDWMHYQDRLNRLSAFLALISGLLSCCAVYGLSISILRDKLKQIAIHKLFGAGTFRLTQILIREFVAQMVMAILIFGPLTYIVLKEILRMFVYSTKFQWLDSLIPIGYCVIVVVLLCAIQIISLNRAHLSSALKGLRSRS